MRILKTEIFDDWFKKLKDTRAQGIILSRIRRIETSKNFGNHKFLGDSIYELKIDYGPGYRVYFAKFDDLIILLTNGGTKKTQSKDINRAKDILRRTKYDDR